MVNQEVFAHSGNVRNYVVGPKKMPHFWTFVLLIFSILCDEFFAQDESKSFCYLLILANVDCYMCFSNSSRLAF